MNRRILHVAAVDFTAVKLLLPQLDHLTRLGFDVRVACRRTDDEMWAALSRFRPIDIGFPRVLHPTQMLRAARVLTRHVGDWRPDILHLHTPAASLPVRALPRKCVPAETLVVYTVHGFLHPWPPTTIRDKLVQVVEQVEARRTDVMLFQSREDFEASSRLGYRSRLTYLGNGVEDHWFEIVPKRRETELQLIFVGRLVREKGVIDLLNSMQDTSGVHLHVVGGALGSDRDPVTAEISGLLDAPGVRDKVTMHGMLNRAQLLRLYDDVDVLCLPSYREGVPRSIIEALAASRPVIATAIRGCDELVDHGSNGWLVPPAAPAQLCEAIQRVADLSVDSLANFSRNARISMDPARREKHVFARIVAAYRGLGVEPAS